MKFEKGKIVAYSPVVKEVEHIQVFFEKITWIGMEDKKRIQSAVSVGKFDNIEYKILPQLGGPTFNEKVKVILYLPLIFIQINKQIRIHDVIHTRGPCFPAYVAALLALFYRKKIWWNKFATNWNAENSSYFFKVHKAILTNSTFSKVTINGKWPGLSGHILSFENPCLSEKQVEMGTLVTNQRTFSKPFKLVFVGNIEKAKGIFDLIEAVSNLEPECWSRLDILGDGRETDVINSRIAVFGKKIQLVGSVATENVHDYLSRADFILLPSHSEGFPKVIAEAACWGCIPVTSAVGSIPQYIKDSENGFLWNLNGQKTFGSILQKVLKTPPESLIRISETANKMSRLFTFERYTKRIKEEILS